MMTKSYPCAACGEAAEGKRARYMLNDVRGSPKRICERIHGKRGYAENRLKELKAGLGMDRACCSKFEANRGTCLGRTMEGKLRAVAIP